MGSPQEAGTRNKACEEKVNRVFRASVFPFIPQNFPKDDENQKYLTLYPWFPLRFSAAASGFYAVLPFAGNHLQSPVFCRALENNLVGVLAESFK